MNNYKKISALALGLIMSGAIVSCGGTKTNPDEEILKGAASYIWSLYKDGGAKTDDFEIVKQCVYDGQKVAVTWTLDVTEGTQDAFEITEGEGTFYTVKVPYYDGKVLANSKYKLSPTVSYNGITKTVAELLGEAKGSYEFSTPAFKISTHDEWLASANGNGQTVNVKGVVIDVIATGSSAGSFYFQDKDGNGYYCYAPSTKGTVKAGDVVVVTGTGTIYNGQHEFNKGGTFHVYTGETQDVQVLNGTSDFKAAKSNKEFDNKYQNNYVKLENCKPTKVDGSYYYFTVDGGTAEFNLYYNTYFLTNDQLKAWTDAFKKAIEDGSTFSVEGIATVYSNAIQIYPSSKFPQAITITGGMSAEEKFAAVDALYTEAFKGKLEAGEVKVTLPTYATTTVEVTEGTTVAVTDGKLIVTPTTEQTAAKVKVTVAVGEETKEYTYDLTIASAVKYDVVRAAAPVAGQGYALYLTQKTLGKNLYFTGAMNGNFLATTEKASEAIMLVPETVEGGYYLSFTVEGAKKYITIANDTAFLSITDAALTVFTYDADLGTFITTTAKSGKEEVFLGTYNNFNTISVSSTSYIKGDKASAADTTQFITHIGHVIEEATPIANVTEKGAEYKIAGTIIGKDGSGRPIIQDAAGSVIYVYDNKVTIPGTSDTIANKAPIGAYVELKGTLDIYNGLNQFKPTTVLYYAVDAGTTNLSVAVTTDFPSIADDFGIAAKDSSKTNNKLYVVTGLKMIADTENGYINASYNDGTNDVTVQLQVSSELKTAMGWVYDKENKTWTGIETGDRYTLTAVSYGTNGTVARLILIGAEAVQPE